MRYRDKTLFGCTFALTLISSTSLLVILGLIDLNQVKAQQQGTLYTADNTNCISYDANRRLITVSCKSATLTDIYNQINNPDVLEKVQDQLLHPVAIIVLSP